MNTTKKHTADQPATAADAITMLTTDHQKVKALFEEFEELKDRDASDDEKAALVQKVCNELKVHAEIEEEIFYPACKGHLEQRLLEEAQVEHDGAKTLIIDPTLVYSTYLEANYVPEAPPAVAVDSAGNVYVSGATVFPGAPVTNQLHAPCTSQPFCSAVFVDKFDSKGNLVYATLLGGSSLHLAQALAVDAAGNAYITGLTTSADFPMVNPLPQSKFVGSAVYVSRLNPAGSALTFSTFLNGSNTTGAGIAVDTSGHAYVTGTTVSADFPTTTGAFQPAFAGPGVTIDGFGGDEHLQSVHLLSFLKRVAWLRRRKNFHSPMCFRIRRRLRRGTAWIS